MSAAENTPNREEAVRACVEQAVGGRVLSLVPIAAGLGLRRFLRVRCEGAVESVVARIDAAEDPAGRPAGAAPEPELEPIRALLEREGLPVPRRLGGDPALGIELLEDLGDETLERASRDATRRDALYPEVLALVPRIQRIAPTRGVAAFERRLDDALLRYKAELFATRGLPRALGREPTPAERSVVLDAFARASAHCTAAPERLAHRDLQSRNVLIRDGHPWLIDLQGAFLAPPEYDLVSLLRDSYVPLPEPLVAQWCEATRPSLPDAPSRDAFALRFALLTLTRKGKDFGRFAYVAEERDDAEAAALLAPTGAMLRRAAKELAATDASFRALADLFEALPGEPSCAR